MRREYPVSILRGNCEGVVLRSGGSEVASFVAFGEPCLTLEAQVSVCLLFRPFLLGCWMCSLDSGGSPLIRSQSKNNVDTGS